MHRARRAFALSAAVVLAGCANILGISDVPEADAIDTGEGGVADATDPDRDGGIDAPFDTRVVPEGGVPDGECNGGAEDCANGLDDNCDGRIDCDDPVCQGAGYGCVESAPAGWTLVSFAAASGQIIPAGCSGAYASTVAQGHDGLSAAAATCGCACAQGQATGTACPVVAVSGYSGTSCNSAVDQSFNITGVACGDFGSMQGSFKANPGTPTALGSCGSPLPSKTVSPLQWANSYAACGYTAPLDVNGCNAGNRCVRLPDSAFDAKPCIAQVGDVACPGSPFGNKSLVDTGSSDTRDCSACTCSASGGSCAATITAYQSNGCTGTSGSVVADGTCTGQGDSFLSVHVDSRTTTPASCSPGTSSPTGSASATGPVTVCCQ